MAITHKALLFSLIVGATLPHTLLGQGSSAAGRAQPRGPQVERPLSFDAAGRVAVLTPAVAARWKLTSPTWPLGDDWKEARLFLTDSASGAAVLVVQRVDGAVARYAYDAGDVARLRSMVDAAVVAQGTANDGARGGSTGFELSEPAGNAFVRNQTVLGLLAYGPATSAILSDSPAAAGGGYLVAAGASFFIAARTVRNRSVTRAQTILAFHGGTRGAIMGAAIGAIGNADGGPGYGAPILAGALGGTIAGFHAARGMSDGEAASSGFGADMTAFTTLGVAGAIGAFNDDTSHHGNGLPQNAKLALGTTIGTALVGYAIGPRYARRSAYNVTAGDIDVGFASALIGGIAANSLLGQNDEAQPRFAATAAGMLLGAFAADRTMIRHADRTSADGTLIQLGSYAGMLMGGGVALMLESEGPVAAGAVALGGVLGLALTDRLVKPAPDAGPKRGVLPSNPGGDSFASRLSLSLVPAATSVAMRLASPGSARVSPSGRVAIRNVQIGRYSF